MDAPATARILCAMNAVPDPRHHNIRHKLIDILTIAMFAVICGAEGWVEVARYGRSKHQWLKTFLELPCGIPSHDTFGKVFARLDPTAMEQCFQQWMAGLVELSDGKLIAIDGKSLRRSYEHGWDKSAMVHMVSAFVEANKMVFGQISTEGKGMELDGIHKLLDMLTLDGTVVSIDALGCQKDIAEKIDRAGGDYVLQAKENQPTLLRKLRATLDDCILDDLRGVRSDSFHETDADHGRIETRRVWACWDVHLLGEVARDWPALRCMVAVEREREINGEKTVERHYYISSLDARRTARQLAGYIRGHWSVENKLHWQLDVSFNEDQRRIRKGNAPEHFSRLCRLALNLLKNEPTQKAGIATKRKMCGWDDGYLLKVVFG
jgi:predicted transposase YbfD/YdcC